MPLRINASVDQCPLFASTSVHIVDPQKNMYIVPEQINYTVAAIRKHPAGMF